MSFLSSNVSHHRHIRGFTMPGLLKTPWSYPPECGCPWWFRCSHLRHIGLLPMSCQWLRVQYLASSLAAAGTCRCAAHTTSGLAAKDWYRDAQDSHRGQIEHWRMCIVALSGLRLRLYLQWIGNKFTIHRKVRQPLESSAIWWSCGIAAMKQYGFTSKMNPGWDGLGSLDGMKHLQQVPVKMIPFRFLNGPLPFNGFWHHRNKKTYK